MSVYYKHEAHVFRKTQLSFLYYSSGFQNDHLNDHFIYKILDA